MVLAGKDGRATCVRSAWREKRPSGTDLYCFSWVTEIASPREATVASTRERIRVGGCVAMLGYVPPGASLGAVTRARACGGGGLSCQVRAARLFLR